MESTVTPYNPIILANCPAAMRKAVTLQSDKSPLPVIQPDTDAALLPYTPDKGISVADSSPALGIDRSTILPPDITVERTNGNQTAVAMFTQPEQGAIGRVERVLWPELGSASVRACAFLYTLRKLGKHRPALDLHSLNMGAIGLWMDCSPTFKATYDAVKAGIMLGRHAETEDTLHSLANGELDKTRQVLDKDGEVVTLTDGKIYSEKALAIALAAGDPIKYGNQQTKAGSGLQIVINLGFSVPDIKAVIDVPSGDEDIEDADEVST